MHTVAMKVTLEVIINVACEDDAVDVETISANVDAASLPAEVANSLRFDVTRSGSAGWVDDNTELYIYDVLHIEPIGSADIAD